MRILLLVFIDNSKRTDTGLTNPALIKMLPFDSFAELAARNLELESNSSSYDRKQFIKKSILPEKLTD